MLTMPLLLKLKLAKDWTAPVTIEGNAKEMEYLTSFLEKDEWKDW